MREIKYRGYNGLFGWVYGFVWSDGRNYIVGDPDGAYYAVMPSSVGQHIVGNIYEGDYLKVYDDNICFEPIVCLARWMGDDYPAFELVEKTRSGKWESVADCNAFSMDLETLEVIGNTYEDVYEDLVKRVKAENKMNEV